MSVSDFPSNPAPEPTEWCSMCQVYCVVTWIPNTPAYIHECPVCHHIGQVIR